MKKVTFELTWNDINTAIADYVKAKAELVLDKETDLPLLTYISFGDNKGNQVGVESASVIVKAV